MYILHYHLPDPVTTTLATLGILLILSHLLRLARFIDLHNRLPNLPTYRHHNAYALVTGASDGIGLALATELSCRGFNIVLHGRNPAKLEAVKSKLLATKLVVPVDVRILIADAGDAQGMEQAVRDMVAGVDALPGPLTVLVNNVGGMSNVAQYMGLGAHSPADVDTILDVNVRFTTQLTRALLPRLKANKPSLVVSTGSITGYFPILGIPYLSVYSGAKAYILAWSQALTREMEYERSGVQVQAWVVGAVTDATHSRAAGTLFTPAASTFAQAALGKVGSGSLLTPYWPHAVQMGVMALLPISWRSTVLIKQVVKLKEAEVSQRAAEVKKQ